MSSSSADPFHKNMTEVLFPNQAFDTHQFASSDWLLGPAGPAPTENDRNLGTVSAAAPTAVPQPTQVAQSPSHSDLGQGQQRNPFIQPSTFRALEGSMPQTNPFEPSSAHSQSIPQPTLYSNVKPAAQQQAATASATTTTRSFAPIAPDPVGLQRIQASRQSQEHDDSYEQRTKKRRLTSSSMEAPQQPPPLRDEDKLLLQLKDEQSLPWKDIAARFQTETGKVHMIPALQMRYKRLKERLQVWTDPDVEALKQAHEYWETKKFDIISSKMLEFGATEKFSPRACLKKWQEMNPQAEYMPPLAVVPGFSQSSTSSVSPQPRQMPGHHMYGSASYASGMYPGPETPQQHYTTMSSASHPSYTSAPAFHQHSPYGSTPGSAQQQYAPPPQSQGHIMYRQVAPPQPGSYSQSPGSHHPHTPQHGPQQPQQQQPQQGGPSRMSTYPPASHAAGNYWQ